MNDKEFMDHHNRVMESLRDDELKMIEDRKREREWNRSRLGRLMNSYWFPTLIGAGLGIFVGLAFALIILYPEKLFNCVP